MLRSMTGFGQSSCTALGFRIKAELRAVNHRFSEITVRLPREWLSLEDEVKREIQHVARRGKIEAFIAIEREDGMREASIDWSVAEGVMLAAERLKERFGLEGTLTVKDLLSVPDLLSLGSPEPDVAGLTAPVVECVREALAAMVAMREAEGDHLARYMAERLDNLDRLRRSIADMAPGAAEEYRQRLLGRLRELLADASFQPDESRLLTEAALLAERSDIGEELSRLEGHLEQCRLLLQASEPVGRKFDFLIQEMNREVNTIGSKSSRMAFSNAVVDMKSELEKLREQAQNVE